MTFIRLKWEQTERRQWTIPSDPLEQHSRIKKSTNRWLDLDYDSYYTYRKGEYVGTFKLLWIAMRNAQAYQPGDGPYFKGDPFK